MSEPLPDAPLDWPVSTRTPELRRGGLAAALRVLLPLGPPALVLETEGQEKDASSLVGRLAGTGCPVLAVVGALACAGASGSATLDDPGEAAGAATMQALRASLAFLSRLRCRRLALPVGDGGVPGADGLRAVLKGSADPTAAVAEWRSLQRVSREEAADRLIQRVDALARSEPHVRFLLVPDGDALSLLDAEVAEWVLEDLPVGNVGLVLETGCLWLAQRFGAAGPAEWLERLGRRVELVAFSDHDGRERADLLPGTGLGSPGDLSDLLPRSVPWVIRGDPLAPEHFLRESASILERALGPPPATEDVL